VNTEQSNGKLERLLREMPRMPLRPEGEQTILRELAKAGEGGSRRRPRHRGIAVAKAGEDGSRRRPRLRGIAAAGAGLAMAALAVILLFAFPGIADFGGRESGHAAQISPKFDLFDEDGRVVYADRLRGIEGKIAFSEYEGGFIADSPESVGKVFWYVWGDREELTNAELVATGTNLDTGETIAVNESRLSGPIYGADAHIVTAFRPFPSKGTWRIDVALDGKPYGSITTRVKDEYIRTANIRFLLSKDDAVTGDAEVAMVLKGHGLSDTVDVFVSPYGSRGRETVKTTFEKTGEYIQAMDPITHYSGRLVFDSPGKWQIEALGEKTIVEVREK